MKLRFNEVLAGPSGWYPLGCVITVETPTDEQQRLIAAGIVSVVREPGAIEIPEPPDATECADSRPFVPRRCPTGVVVCLGGGPSLTQADVEFVRGKATVIAINDAYKLAPWADVLYAADAAWWRHHWSAVRDLACLKYSIRSADVKLPEDGIVTVLQNTGNDGLELQPTGLKTGANSGYQAVNLAVHLGARRIVLLGYDMGHGKGQRSHWFGDHPKGLQRSSPYDMFIGKFQTIVAPLQQRGIDLVNCSRQTALECVPRQSLDAAMLAAVAA